MKTLRSILITTTVIIAGCSTSIPIAATSNAAGPFVKTGTAKEVRVMGITVRGEATIRAAVTSGAITKIATVDFKRSNVLGIVQVSTCIVTGE